MSMTIEFIVVYNVYAKTESLPFDDVLSPALGLSSDLFEKQPNTLLVCPSKHHVGPYTPTLK